MSLAAVVAIAVGCAALSAALLVALTRRPIEHVGRSHVRTLRCGANVFDMASELAAVSPSEGKPAQPVTTKTLISFRSCGCFSAFGGISKCDACSWLREDRQTSKQIQKDLVEYSTEGLR